MRLINKLLNIITKIFRYLFSFIIFIFKWVLPLSLLLAISVQLSIFLVDKIPQKFQNNDLLIAVIPAIISFSFLKWIEAYLHVLNKKGKHLKKVNMNLSELNSIYQTSYLNLNMINSKLKSCKQVFNDFSDENFRANLYSDDFIEFSPVTSDMFEDLLNVSLINSIESIRLQLVTNNLSIKNINARHLQVQSKIFSFVEKYHHYQNYDDLEYRSLLYELKNLIDILSNLRKEITKTQYYILFTLGKFTIAHQEDPISFVVFVITNYLSEFNRRDEYNSFDKLLKGSFAKQFKLNPSKVRFFRKLLTIELNRIKQIT